MPEFFDPDQPIFRNSPSLELVPVISPTSTASLNGSLPTPTEHSRARCNFHDPGNAILLQNLDPTSADLASLPQRCCDESPAQDQNLCTTAHMGSVFHESVNVEAPGSEVPGAPADAAHEERHDSANTLDSKALQASASAAVAESENTQPSYHAEERSPKSRVDSAQDGSSQPATDDMTAHSRSRSPLNLRTSRSNPDMRPVPANMKFPSPTLERHAQSLPEPHMVTLPVVTPASAQDTAGAASPRSERLPSFRQLTELADAAAQEPRQFAHGHSRSFSSTTSQSPRLLFQYPPPSAQTSPINHYTINPRSPTNSISETQHNHYASPTQYPVGAYYTDRRTSAGTDSGSHFSAPMPPAATALSDTHNQPQFPPSLQSASSSGDSHGHAGSSTDGYSTTQTTPIDSATVDSTSRPILPPPPGMPQSAAIINGGFKCDWPGCHAQPFQTQYLLRYAFLSALYIGLDARIIKSPPRSWNYH